jgi:hypothetical protein
VSDATTDVARFCRGIPGVKMPRSYLHYANWRDVPSMSGAGPGWAVVVDGGVLGRPLDLGEAIVLARDGVLSQDLWCGLFGALGQTRVIGEVVERRRLGQ